MRVTIPAVPDGSDVYRSWRRVLTGLDLKKQGAFAVCGPLVGHGAVVETVPGVLLLVVDKRFMGWAERHPDRKPYQLMASAVSLHLVQDDGALTILWGRSFETSKGAFGTGTRTRLKEYLAQWPPPADPLLTVLDPGPGRPNCKPGPCRWCHTLLQEGQGVLVGSGEAIECEHNRRCPAEPATPGTNCARCGKPVAPGTATVVIVREGAGRRETQHTGECGDHPSYGTYQRREAERAAREQRQRAAARAAEEKLALQRAAARKRTQMKRRETKEAEKAAAAEVQRRVESLAIKGEVRRTELFDKKLGPGGERMRLSEVTAELADGAPATWWEVAAYGGAAPAEEDDRGGRYFRKEAARREYQWHKPRWEA